MSEPEFIETTFDDPDIDQRNVYSRFSEVFYKSHPFTGLINQDNECIPFVNGNAHGVYELNYSDGQPWKRETFENGVSKDAIHYWKTGKTSFKQVGKQFQRWNSGGVLIHAFDGLTYQSYYQHGALKSELIRGREFTFYTRTVQLFARGTQRAVSKKANPAKVQFSDDVLVENYMDLLIPDEQFPEPDRDHSANDKHRINLVWQWLWQVYERDKDSFFSMFGNLLNHTQKPVLEQTGRITALHKFHDRLPERSPANAKGYEWVDYFTAEYERNPLNFSAGKPGS